MEASVSYRIKQDGFKAGRGTGDPFSYDDLESFFAFTKESLLNIATDARREEQAKGFDKNPLTLVDGRRNDNIKSVKPLGQIQFVTREDLSEIILYTYEKITLLSPFLDGDYRNSNVVLVNGRPVASSVSSLTSWLKRNTLDGTEKIRLVNSQPYARKLERLGVTSGGQQIQVRNPKKSERRKVGSKIFVPNGTYSVAALAARSKYGANAFIRFQFLLATELSFSGGDTRYKRGKSVGKPYLYPTILIAPAGQGSKI